MSTGCSRMQYAKEGDPLWPLVGTTWVLLADCYVVQYVDPSDGLNGPMLTCNIKKPGIGSRELPVEVKSEFVGRVYGTEKIIGIVSKGSAIRISGIKWLVSVEDKIPIFEVEQVGEDEKGKSGTKYDVIWLLNRRHLEAGFDESIAQRVQKPVVY